MPLVKMPSILNNRKVYPPRLINRALVLLAKHDQGMITPKRIIHHRFDGELHKLDLGIHYRLMTRDGVVWWIVSHEFYSRKMLK